MSRRIEDFSYFFDFWKHRADKIKYSIFKRISTKALPMFFKGQDIISNAPITSGVHEAEIKDLIDFSAANGYSDFFIDIGANIGLTSCQSGLNFKEIHMFEPNPNILNILKVNTKIMLRNHPYTIHECGLGDEEAVLDLYVPFDNWGGAFVMSDKSTYDKNLLSAKDGYGDFDINNYEILKVKIAAAKDYLTRLFNSLNDKNLRSGVIKIDVEGFEKLVIGQLLSAFPANFKAVLVFENWKDDLNLSDFTIPDRVSVQAYSIVSEKIRFKSLPRFVNSLISFAKGGFHMRLEKVEHQFKPGNCVFIVN